MNRFAAIVGAALAVGCAFTANAQVPADPNNPNEVLPEASNPAPYGETINIETAKKAAAAAIAEAKKRNWNTLCVAVVSPSGDLVYFVIYYLVKKNVSQRFSCQFNKKTLRKCFFN